MAASSSSIADEAEDIREHTVVLCLYPMNLIDELRQALHAVNRTIVYQSDVKSCTTFIESSGEKRILLVVSHWFFSDMVSHADVFQRMDGIFVVSSPEHQHKNYFHEQLSVVGVYVDFDALTSSVNEQLDGIDREHYRWSICDQAMAYGIDLSKQSSDFFWAQLFHRTVRQHPGHMPSRKKLIELFHSFAPDNTGEMKDICKLIRVYRPSDALHGYFQAPLFRRTIDRAVQSKNIRQLCLLWCFIGDLINALAHARDGEKPATVHHRMKLTSAEVNDLYENLGRVLVWRGFLLANDAHSSPAPSDLIDVLFEIETDIEGTQFARGPANRVLFDLNTTFRLNHMEWQEQTCLIRLVTVQDGALLTDKYIADTGRQLGDLSMALIFGRFLDDMNRWEDARVYSQHLMERSYEVGRTLHWRGEWSTGAAYLQGASRPIAIDERFPVQDSALNLADLGEAYFVEGEYDEAYSKHQAALKIRQKYYPSDHPCIAASLESLGLLFCVCMKYGQARVFLEQALVIREKYYGHSHVDVAKSLISLSHLFFNLERYDEALACVERAMFIYEQLHQCRYVQMVEALRVMGDVRCRQGRWDESLQAYYGAWILLRKLHVRNGREIVKTLITFAKVRRGQEMYRESIDLYQQAWNKACVSYQCDGILKAFLSNALGSVEMLHSCRYHDALHVYRRTLTFLEDEHWARAVHMAVIHSCMGDIQDDAEACVSFQTSLQLLIGHYASDRVELAATLVNIGRDLMQRGKTDEALALYQRASRIRQKKQSSSESADFLTIFSDIGRLNSALDTSDEILALFLQICNVQFGDSTAWLNNDPHAVYIISNVMDNEANDDQVIEFYRHALDIQQRYLPAGHSSIISTLYYLGDAVAAQTQNDAGMSYFDRGMELLRANYPCHQQVLADGLIKIATAFLEPDNFDKAVDHFQQALLILEKLSPLYQRSSANILFSIGNLRSTQGKDDEALEYYQRALIIEEAGDFSSHSDIRFKLLRIAGVLRKLQRFRETLQCYQRILAIDVQCYPSDHIQIATDHRNLAEMFHQLGRWDAAIASYRQAAAIQEKRLTIDDQIQLANDLEWIAHMLADLNEFDEAMRTYKRSLTIRQRWNASGFTQIIVALTSMSNISLHRGNYEKALKYQQRELAVQLEHNPTDHVAISQCLMRMGETQSRRGEPQLARDYYSQALDRLAASESANYTELADCIGRIANAYDADGLPDQARGYLEQRLQIIESNPSLDHELLADALWRLGQSHERRSDHRLTLAYRMRCYLMLEKALEPSAYLVGKSLVCLAESHENLNKLNMALDFYQRALAVYEHHEGFLFMQEQLRENIVRLRTILAT